MTYLNLFMCGSVLCWPGLAVLAEDTVASGPGGPAVQADLELGAYLSAECVTCHQNTGKTDGIPKISGMNPKDFVAAMLAYKQDEREHPIMQMIAGRLNNDEIAALAAYFETID